MSTRSSSFFQRLIRALARGSVPIDGSQCDGPCVVNGPQDVQQAQRDRESERKAPIRWLSLR